MKHIGFLKISDLSCQLLHNVDNNRSPMDVKKAISNSTGMDVHEQLFLCNGYALGDDVVTRYKDLVFVFPVDHLRLQNPDLGHLPIATVPECSEKKRKKLAMGCMLYAHSLMKWTKYNNKKKDDLERAEFQLRSYVNGYLDLMMKRLSGGQKIVLERLKRINNTHDMVRLTVFSNANLQANCLMDVEECKNKYRKVSEKLMGYKALIQTFQEKNKDTSNLPFCENDNGLENIRRNINRMDNSCQKFAGDSEEFCDQERNSLRDHCMKISEHFKSSQVTLNGMIEMYMSQIRCHLEGHSNALKVAEHLHLVCSEDEELDIILEKCEKDVKDTLTMRFA